MNLAYKDRLSHFESPLKYKLVSNVTKEKSLIYEALY